MALTEIQIKQIKPKEKRFMIRDDRGLYIEIMPSGNKHWRLRYWEGGKERKIDLGQYPGVSLRDARIKRDGISLNREKGISPREEKNHAPTFEEIFQEWYRVKISPLSKNYSDKIKLQMNKHAIPDLGNMLISDIRPADILGLCRKLEGLSTDTAHRIRQFIGQVFRFAIAANYVETDPTYALRGALATHKEKNYPTITDNSKIALLIRSINEYPYDIVRLAMKFSMLTFVRPGEVCHAEWSEIDFDKKIWNIPAEKMKMEREHIVPLSSQLLQILQELKPLTGSQKWLFPSSRNDSRPMSDNTVRIALRTMGYSNEDIVPHGFRAMASTILHDNEFPHEHIEMQLAHAPKDKISAAYNRAKYLPQRREMMQWYADWLDNLK